MCWCLQGRSLISQDPDVRTGFRQSHFIGGETSHLYVSDSFVGWPPNHLKFFISLLAMICSLSRIRTKAFLLVVVLLLVNDASAWSVNLKRSQRKGVVGKVAKLKQPLTSQKMLRSSTLHQLQSNSKKRRTMKLSNSVLASCDTLPAFPTAHGLLSPETVQRIHELNAGDHGSDALTRFLEQYQRKGPVSCLSMLSDPAVLPHLTQAMRDVSV